ncbi:PEP-CTERM sorting domain-containing protein [Ideonella sp. DXS22W]|uniref:PEP-CTERM sorting domain-containing protein n=1 Tax=Pseudaquabacterium inlustre TaxID=2984192 RepID=A0ABU9CCS2_9BURK
MHKPVQQALATIMLVLASASTVHAADVTVSVTGLANPKLAGMPVGSVAGVQPGNPSVYDTAPAQSPLEVTGLSLVAGTWMQFTQVSGQVGNCGGGCWGGGPDGSNSLYSFDAENGISGIVNARLDALVGVFLGAQAPNLGTAPAALNFGAAGTDALGTDFTTLAPALQQVFFIGDGLTGTGGGTVQSFRVPVGATRLFLGTMDAYEWNNNINPGLAITATVSAVPEPASTALLLAGLGLVGVAARRRR